MRLSSSLLAAAFILSASASASSFTNANEHAHKRFVVARRSPALPPINVLGGLGQELGLGGLGQSGQRQQDGAAAAQGGSLLKRDPLVGNVPVAPLVGGLTSGLLSQAGSVGGGVGGVRKVLPVGAAAARSVDAHEESELGERSPLGAGLPIVGGLLSGAGGGGAAPAPASDAPPGAESDEDAKAPTMIGVSQLGGQEKREPLLGGAAQSVGIPSLGGLTSALGVNKQGKTDSLVPISLGQRAVAGAPSPALLKTVRASNEKLGRARDALAAAVGQNGAQPEAKEALTSALQKVGDALTEATHQLSIFGASSSPNSDVQKRQSQLTLPGLLADLIGTVNSVLAILETPLQQLLGDVLGAVADALAPFAGPILQSIYGLLGAVEGIVMTLGLQLGPVIQPVLDLVQGLAAALGIHLAN